ncbi:MAG: hypothetical protein WC866_03660 [Patescibacteria group bacterium]
MPHIAHKKAPRTKAQQELLLGFLVGVSMLGITGLYALTLRYQDIGTHPDDVPRWSVLTDGVITRAAPIKAVLLDVANTLSVVSTAHDAQSQAVENLKAKILSGETAPATTTPETETP